MTLEELQTKFDQAHDLFIAHLCDCKPCVLADGSVYAPPGEVLDYCDVGQALHDARSSADSALIKESATGRWPHSDDGSPF